MASLFFFGISLILAEASWAHSGVRVVVNTEGGQIAGYVNGSMVETACVFPPMKYLHLRGTPNVATFLGIPFAAAPIDELRFRPPRRRMPWSGVLEAIAPSAVCPQLPLVSLVKVPESLAPAVDEDCLYLNVWAPTSADGLLNGSKRPTLLFLHGGAFMTGSGYQEVNCAFYNAQGLASDTNTIVVTTNYRLGVFGFFADPQLLAESGTTGNYGLQDQRAAMTWVQRNIVHFGGDGKRVTIMGESAGAASVLHHLVLPRSAGLFAAAIAQSGYDLSWSLSSAYATSDLMANGAGCKNSTARLRCLRQLPAKDLLVGQQSLFFQPGFDFLERALAFGPVSDGFEVPTNMTFAQMFSQAKPQTPLLLGSNLNETNLIFCLDKAALANVTTWEDAEMFIQHSILKHIPESTATASDVRLFTRYYRNFSSPSEAVMAATTDAVFTCPARRVANAMRGPTYRYLFARPPRMCEADSCLGVPHAADLIMLFYKAFPTEAESILVGDAHERALAEAMVKAWGHFAWHGTPGPTLDWPSWNASEPTIQLGARRTTSASEDDTENHLASPTDKQLGQILEGYQLSACKVFDERIQPNKQLVGDRIFSQAAPAFV